MARGKNTSRSKYVDYNEHKHNKKTNSKSTVSSTRIKYESEESDEDTPPQQPAAAATSASSTPAPVSRQRVIKSNRKPAASTKSGVGPIPLRRQRASNGGSKLSPHIISKAGRRRIIVNICNNINPSKGINIPHELVEDGGAFVENALQFLTSNVLRWTISEKGKQTKGRRFACAVADYALTKGGNRWANILKTFQDNTNQCGEWVKQDASVTSEYAHTKEGELRQKKKVISTIKARETFLRKELEKLESSVDSYSTPGDDYHIRQKYSITCKKLLIKELADRRVKLSEGVDLKSKHDVPVTVEPDAEVSNKDDDGDDDDHKSNDDHGSDEEE